MDTLIMTKIGMALAIAGLVIGVIAIATPLFDDDAPEDDLEIKYVLHFGLPSTATQEDMGGFQQYVCDRIVDGGYGYTIYWATGGHVEGDTVIHGEHTLVVNIAFTEESFVDTLVDDVIDEYGIVVMVEKVHSDIELRM